MGKLGGFIEKYVLYHEAFDSAQRCLDVLGVGVGLSDVFALTVEPFKVPIQSRIKHVWNAQAGFRIERYVPLALEELPRCGIRNMPVTGQFMRK